MHRGHTQAVFDDPFEKHPSRCAGSERAPGRSRVHILFTDLLPLRSRRYAHAAASGAAPRAHQPEVVGAVSQHAGQIPQDVGAPFRPGVAPGETARHLSSFIQVVQGLEVVIGVRGRPEGRDPVARPQLHLRLQNISQHRGLAPEHHVRFHRPVKSVALLFLIGKHAQFGVNQALLVQSLLVDHGGNKSVLDLHRVVGGQLVQIFLFDAVTEQCSHLNRPFIVQSPVETEQNPLSRLRLGQSFLHHRVKQGELLFRRYARQPAVDHHVVVRQDVRDGPGLLKHPVGGMFVRQDQARKNGSALEVDGLGFGSGQRPDHVVASRGQNLPVPHRHRLGDGPHAGLEGVIIHRHNLSAVEDHLGMSQQAIAICLLSPSPGAA